MISLHLAITLVLAGVVLIQNGRRLVEAIAWCVEKLSGRT
jgi:hypothetical protein